MKKRETKTKSPYFRAAIILTLVLLVVILISALYSKDLSFSPAISKTKPTATQPASGPTQQTPPASFNCGGHQSTPAGSHKYSFHGVKIIDLVTLYYSPTGVSGPGYTSSGVSVWWHPESADSFCSTVCWNSNAEEASASCPLNTAPLPTCPSEGCVDDPKGCKPYAGSNGRVQITSGSGSFLSSTSNNQVACQCDFDADVTCNFVQGCGPCLSKIGEMPK